MVTFSKIKLFDMKNNPDIYKHPTTNSIFA